MRRMTLSFTFEEDNGFEIEEFFCECDVKYSIDPSYGEDADGKGGVIRATVDEVTLTRVEDSMYCDQKIEELDSDFKQRIIDFAENLFLESDHGSYQE